jgi:hypothetical protein
VVDDLAIDNEGDLAGGATDDRPPFPTARNTSIPAARSPISLQPSLSA